jgi:putative protease
VEGRDGYIFEDPASLDVLSQLESLRAAGVKALKVEGRQRGRAYVAQVIREIRRVLDDGDHGGREALVRLSEGQRTTTGAYEKKWR